MSAESTLDPESRNDQRWVVLVSIAIVGLGLLFGAYSYWTVLERSQRYKQITVGMTVDEVVDLLGEPRHQSKAGEPLNPPMVAVPAGTAYEHAYTYFTLFTFVYVLFDDQDRVVVYYTFDT